MIIMDMAQLKSKLDGKEPIEGATLTDVDWSDPDCEEARFTDCVIEQAQFANVIFADARLAGADLRGAEISGLNLMSLGSFAGLKINQSQQHDLLLGIGVDVYPEPA